MSAVPAPSPAAAAAAAVACFACRARRAPCGEPAVPVALAAAVGRPIDVVGRPAHASCRVLFRLEARRSPSPTRRSRHHLLPPATAALRRLHAHRWTAGRGAPPYAGAPCSTARHTRPAWWAATGSTGSAWERACRSCPSRSLAWRRLRRRRRGHAVGDDVRMGLPLADALLLPPIR